MNMRWITLRRPSRWTAAYTTLILALSGCTLLEDTHHSINTDPRELTYPERIEKVGWEWEVPEGERLVDTVAIPVGIAVLLNSGFIALAGDTGNELWEYRPGKNARLAYASHLGDYLALEIDDPEDGPILVELDPSTGEILQESALETSIGDQDGIDDKWFSRNAADGMRIGRDPFDDPALRGVSLATGEALWVQEEPPECTTVDGPIRDTTESMILGDVVLEGFFCTGGKDEDGGGLIGRDLATGEEIWRFEEQYGYPYLGLIPPERDYDPLTDRHLAVRTVNAPTLVFDVVDGEYLGEWDGVVVGIMEDESVVVQYTEDGEYRREDSSGNILETMPIDPGDGIKYPVVLQDGIVSRAWDNKNSKDQIWFQPWGDNNEPSMIDMSNTNLENKENNISLTAVPGAVIISSSKEEDDENEGKSTIIGLI